MTRYAMPASEQEMCRCSDHAAHLRDTAKASERTAHKFRDIGDMENYYSYMRGAVNCRRLADELDAYKQEGK